MTCPALDQFDLVPTDVETALNQQLDYRVGGPRRVPTDLRDQSLRADAKAEAELGTIAISFSPAVAVLGHAKVLLASRISASGDE